MTQAPKQPADLRIIESLNKAKAKMLAELHKVIIGQDAVIELLIQALLSRGHCLLVGVPGLAKTLMISTLARVLKLKYADAAPSAMIGASNHFEVAIATATMLFGLGSGAALATVVGVLI